MTAVPVTGDVRAAWWAVRSIRRARRLEIRSVRTGALPDVPRLSPSAAVQGEDRGLAIGVTTPSTNFAAHAWLDGDPPCHAEGFHELTRQPDRQ